ncbi:MAG: DsrE/DsrF/DrsH-like family protein, partial [Victivallales bacterium]|nr:DsrE/DsrF/DrsH-like family protein [Victivallales bacterium]
VLFEKNGKLLGAQTIAPGGVDKRIALLAAAIRNGLTVSDLAELELAYAPPYGSAKDPINFIGYIGENIIRGDTLPVFADELKDDDFLLDVRENDEILCGAIPNAVNIPLGELRDKRGALPKDKRIVVFCRSGLRGYLAERYLRQHGFDVGNFSGGYVFWKLFNSGEADSNISYAPCCNGKPCSTGHPEIKGTDNEPMLELDACGLQCPGPIVKVKNRLDAMNTGEILRVTAGDAGFYNDLPAWCTATGNTLVSIEKTAGKIQAIVQKGENPSRNRTTAVIPKRTTIVLFSNDLDKALAAFIIASGFASLGHEVSIFCTFWGLSVLRKDQPPRVKKNLIGKMFGMMLPRGARKLALSKMHMLGMGTAMIKQVMKNKNINSLPELITQARALGVKFTACEMAMNMMGIQPQELLDGVETAGVANFAALAEKSGPVLFI